MKQQPLNIGILALQGAVEAHANMLARLSVNPVWVRTPKDLDGLSGIILPGGESTTMLHVLHLNQLFDPLRRFVSERPAWGVCAGAILLAKTVLSPKQSSLEAMDLEVTRNAFGRQTHSFIAPLVSTNESLSDVTGVFIRAPRFTGVGKSVEVLLTFEGEPVMVCDRHLLASSFHPELTDDTRIHQYFLSKCEAAHGRALS